MINPTDYNRLAKDYRLHRSAADTELVFGYQSEIDLLEPLSGKHILDFGCGEGKFCRMLSAKGAHATGIDSSEAMIQHARAQDRIGITYICTKEDQPLPFLKNSFDVVCLNFVLCTFLTKEKIQETLQEISRVLKNGGSLILLTSNWEEGNGKDFISFRLVPIQNPQPGDKVYIILKGDHPILLVNFFWTAPMYIKMFEEAGFVITKNLKPTTNQRGPWLDELIAPPMVLIQARKK